MAWTTEMSDRATLLGSEGFSGRQIARKISEEFDTIVSRNAVMGIFYRLGIKLTKKQSSSSPEKKPRRRRSPFNGGMRLHLPPTPFVEVIVAPDFLGISLIDLQEGQCRYPRGHGQDISFCGQPVRNAGEAWCHHCRGIVYRPTRHNFSAEATERMSEAGHTQGLANVQRERRQARGAA